MTLSHDEFLRRFLLHLLPKGFVRIRHFGFLANRRRAALLPQCFAALHATPPKNESETSTAPTPQPLWRCPKCGGPMARRRTIHRGTTPTPFSTAPGHGCMKSLAHTPHCRRASERFAEVCLRYPQTSSSCSRLGSLRPSTRLCTRCAGCYSSGLDDSRELLHPSLAPFNLHKSRVRRASGFLLTAFSNATPHTFFSALSTHPGVASEKALASTGS